MTSKCAWLAAGLAAGLFAPGLALAWELRVCAEPASPPFSTREGTGLDNRIAAILADEMGAELTHGWLPDARGRTRLRHLHAGACDLAMGALEGQSGMLTSHAYYRTGYVFVHDPAVEIASLDDPVLRGLRVGLPGGARKTTPPALGLARRGIVENQRHYDDRGGPGDPVPPVLRALEAGEVDVAVLWGPVAAAFAGEGTALTPVRPEIDVPFTPMVASLAVGMRPGDEALRDAVDLALASAWDRVQAVIEEEGVPTLPLPRPTPSLAGVGQ